VFDEEHPRVLATMGNLAAVYEAQGRHDEAEPLLEKALATSRRALPEGHPYTPTFMYLVALLYKAQSRYDEAEPLFEKALAMHRQVLGEEHPSTLTSMHGLAELYHDQERYTESEPLLRECLAGWKKKQPDNWQHFCAMSLLGASLMGQAQSVRATNAEAAEKKLAEAEPLLVQGYDGMKRCEAKIPAHRKEELTTSLRRVVELYDAWGKAEQASEWKKKMK
jgi:tetratricopeptide (TPR) repeat protein